MAYGRPMKGGSRRTPITVHAPNNIIDMIDAHVEEYAAETETAYSRSDFYNEAAIALLRSRGIEVEDTPKRNKSVTRKSADETSGENTDNTDKIEGEKTPPNTQR